LNSNVLGCGRKKKQTKKNDREAPAVEVLFCQFSEQLFSLVAGKYLSELALVLLS